MNAFSKQQTIETIRQNIDNWASIHMVSDDQAEVNREQYAAEKARRYKLSLIRKWREKK